VHVELAAVEVHVEEEDRVELGQGEQRAVIVEWFNYSTPPA
jgi:hypothetical protein